MFTSTTSGNANCTWISQRSIIYEWDSLCECPVFNLVTHFLLKPELSFHEHYAIYVEYCGRGESKCSDPNSVWATFNCGTKTHFFQSQFSSSHALKSSNNYVTWWHSSPWIICLKRCTHTSKYMRIDDSTVYSETQILLNSPINWKLFSCFGLHCHLSLS